jgi:hypothetical protein
MMMPYKTCRAPISMASFNPPWQDLLHVYKKDASDPDALQCTKGVSHRGTLVWIQI